MRFEKVGDQLLGNNGFSRGLQGWAVNISEEDNVTLDQGRLALHSSDARKHQQVTQSLEGPFPSERLFFQATIKTKDIIAGIEPWNKGRIVVVQYIDDMPQYAIPHGFVSLDGTNSKKQYRRIFSIAPSTTKVKVAVQLSRCTGSLEVGEITLYGVMETVVYDWLRKILFCGWGLFLLLFLFSFMRGSGYLSFKIFLIVVVVAIIAGTSISAKNKKYGSDKVMEVVHNVEKMVDFTLIPECVEITKVAHFCLFGFLALGMIVMQPNAGLNRVVWGVLMMAIGSEFIQYFVDGRTPLIMDVGIDMAGGCSVLLASSFWIFFKQKKGRG